MAGANAVEDAADEAEVEEDEGSKAEEEEEEGGKKGHDNGFKEEGKQLGVWFRRRGMVLRLGIFGGTVMMTTIIRNRRRHRVELN